MGLTDEDKKKIEKDNGVVKEGKNILKIEIYFDVEKNSVAGLYGPLQNMMVCDHMLVEALFLLRENRKQRIEKKEERIHRPSDVIIH